MIVGAVQPSGPGFALLWPLFSFLARLDEAWDNLSAYNRLINLKKEIPEDTILHFPLKSPIFSLRSHSKIYATNNPHGREPNEIHIG